MGSNQSTRPVPTPKPIKLHTPLLPQPQLLLLPQLPLVPTPLLQLLPSPQLASLLPQLLLSQSLLLNTKYFPPQNIRKFKSGQFVNFETKLGAKTLTSNLYKIKLKASKQCQRTN